MTPAQAFKLKPGDKVTPNSGLQGYDIRSGDGRYDKPVTYQAGNILTVESVDSYGAITIRECGDSWGSYTLELVRSADQTPVAIKGLGYDKETGGFETIFFDDKPVSRVDLVAAARNAGLI